MAKGEGKKCSDIIESVIFTKKAKKEGKEAFILQALQKSVQGRKDKNKILTLPFLYDGFRKYYNE